MVRFPTKDKNFSLFQNIQTFSGAHTASFFLTVYKNFILGGNDGVGMKLTTNLHLPLVRISGATLTLPHTLL
jgi:hypothetical protein